MKYPRLTHKLMCEPWCVTEAMHASMVDILAAHVEGKSVMTDFQKPDVAKADSNSGPYGSVRVPDTGGALSKRGKLGIITLEGVMGTKLSWMEEMCGGCSIEALQAAIESAYNDPTIARVLFDISSPGGTACGTPETAGMVADLSRKKETFSASIDICGSAAQWVAAQCRTSYGTTNGTYGSIGCFIAKLDLSKQREMEGENLQIIRGGKYKAMGMDAPLTDDERALLQAIVDENTEAFRNDVRAGRERFAKKKVSDETMQGQIFSGTQAIQNGLLDALVPSIISIVRSLSA